MAVVSHTELIVQQVGRWIPGDVAFVRGVSFENWERDSFDLALVLLLQPRPPLSEGWPDPTGSYWEADIVFSGVRNLRLTVTGPWDIQTPGFELQDIRDRQWEGINLLVDDYEGLTTEGISFGAKSATVRSCNRAQIPPKTPSVWREYPGVLGG